MDNNPYIVAQYLIYLVLSLSVTWAVGRTLYKNGAIFLVDTFKGREGLAESVNHLLVVGFYLVNFGWVIRGVKATHEVVNSQQMIENIASDLGSVFLILGAMHFMNLYVFNRIRARGENLRQRDVPPLRPTEFLRPTAEGSR